MYSVRPTYHSADWVGSAVTKLGISTGSDPLMYGVQALDS